MIYAIIDTKTGAIVNRIEYADPPKNPPPGLPSHYIAVQHDRADASWTWDGKSFSPPPPVEEKLRTPLEKLEAIGLSVADLKELMQ